MYFHRPCFKYHHHCQGEPLTIRIAFIIFPGSGSPLYAWLKRSDIEGRSRLGTPFADICNCSGKLCVTGVTTPLDNILSNLYMYLDAYDRRSYSL